MTRRPFSRRARDTTMADRYQGRPPADDEFDRGDQRAPARKSDPLAELARLIGQTDPFGNLGRANQPMPAPHVEENYEPEPALEVEESAPAARPGWMRRVLRQEETPAQDFPSSVHPLKGYAASHAAPEPDYQQEVRYSDDERLADPSRYDDAPYSQLDHDAQHARYDPAYSDDPYAYEEDGEENFDHGLKKRRGGMVTVAVVLALAVLGTGGAFAYRTYLGSPRSGEPRSSRPMRHRPRSFRRRPTAQPKRRIGLRLVRWRKRLFREKNSRSMSTVGRA